MDWLEQELKQALERKDPPPGFAARVAAATAAQSKPRAVPRWLPAAAAILLVAGGGAGGAAYRHYQGVAAKEQVMEAMRITAEKLNHIQSRVKEVQR